MGGMIDINVTLLIQAVNFLILMVVLDRIFYRPLLERMDFRRKSAEALRVATEAMGERLAAGERDYEDRLDKARAEAIPLRLDPIGEAYDRFRERLDEARKAADTRLRDHDDRVAAKRSEAWKTLEAGVGPLALALTERLAEGKTPDGPDSKGGAS